MDKKFAKYEKISNQFTKFFNSDDLESVLNAKADTKKVEKMLVDKASQLDIHNCLKVVDNLFKRIY
jgi:hypothetical protein